METLLGGGTPCTVKLLEMKLTIIFTKIGPHLPVPMAEHCVIKITDEKILFIGGDSQIGLDATLFYDIATETFSEGPRLNHGR